MLQNNSVLKSKIDQLWNKFWAGGISNPLTAIEQITYLLFMKRLDDLDRNEQSENKNKKVSNTSKFYGDWIPPEYRSKINGAKSQIEKKKLIKQYGIDKSTFRWSVFKHMEADKMLMHIQSNVFPFLKELNGEQSPFSHYMQNAVFIIPKHSLLNEAITTIEEIFTEIEKDAKAGGQSFQDIQGDVYEMLLSAIATAGKNGQFRTPRHIIKLIAELVAPKFGNQIADPACGTGGFLLGAYQYIVTQLANNKAEIMPDEDGFIRSRIGDRLTTPKGKILNDSLHGYDIDVTMVRLGLMNLMMHGVDTPHIDYKDTLSKSFNESNKYHIVMANPPFTGSINKGDINETLKLGISTNKTELLFIKNIYNLLKNNGTAGVIVPQGVLFGSGSAFVETRKILVDKCELKAVIAMPSGVFKPYAGVNTAILVFTKGAETKNVWFYDMQRDGYSLDDKRIKLDGYGDLQDIVEQFKKRDQKKKSDRKAKFFFVPKNEIVKENYDLSISKYKEDVFEEITYEKPKAIFTKLKTIENEITSELSELEGMLQ